jgi:hypothetical protein
MHGGVGTMERSDALSVEIIGGTGRAIGDHVSVFYTEEGRPLRLAPDAGGAWVVEAITAFDVTEDGQRSIPSARLTLRRVAAGS